MVSMGKIERYCARIAEAFQPQRIILFGSHAYGRPHEDSDVVFSWQCRNLAAWGAVLRSKSGSRWRLTSPWTFSSGIRTFSATGSKEGDTFLEVITERGRLMYEAGHA